MAWAELEIKKESGTSVGDRVLIMLLSLNFLLLAFFILMNGMATREKHHAQAVLAKMREGYDIQGPVGDDTGTAPRVAMNRWQETAGPKIQGLVVNRLHLETVPLEIDGERLVMRFPLGAFFNGSKLLQPEAVRNMISAVGNEASLHWEIGGDMAEDDAMVAKQAAALAEVTHQVEISNGTSGVKIVFIPGTLTQPDAAATLQHLTINAGASDVHGEADAK